MHGIQGGEFRGRRPENDSDSEYNQTPISLFTQLAFKSQ